MRVSRRRFPLDLLLACLGVGIPAAAEPAARWQVLPSGLELRCLEPAPGTGVAGPIVLVRRPATSSARLRVRAPPGGLLVNELASEERVLAAVNANFFDSSAAPLGWVVAGGRELSPLNRRGWGVLTVDEAGRPTIARAASAPPAGGVREAVQAGPLLVERGRPNQGLKAQEARRVFVGLDAEGRLVLGSTGFSRADARALAWLLSAPESEGGAGLREVLNLDGGSSAQVFVRGAPHEGGIDLPGLVRVPVALALESPPAMLTLESPTTAKPEG